MRAKFTVTFSQEPPLKRSRKTPVNSFQTALDAASKRLAQALDERTAALATLGALNAEIPALQQTISALQQQLNPNAAVFRNSQTGQETTVGGEVRVPAVPPELARFPQDLTGMSSSFNAQPVQADADGEELPEIDGDPVVEE